MDGAVPTFTHRCMRSGRCCSGGDGYVWLEGGEAEAMAAALDMDVAAFEDRFVAVVPDPNAPGTLRRTLRQRAEGDGGRCLLLEGRNECSVYTARPRHCATYPFWPSILSDPEAFERARATCPGIRVEATAEQRAEGFRRLAAVYAELDEVLAAAQPVCVASGLCCRFEEAEHVLYATALEADYAVAHHPAAPAPEAEGRCPYHVKGRCTAREGRPLGCRSYFCDRRTTDELEAAHERLLGEIRSIERELGYPAVYAPFPELLEDRGVGVPGAGKTAGGGASEAP